MLCKIFGVSACSGKNSNRREEPYFLGRKWEELVDQFGEGHRCFIKEITCLSLSEN